MPRVNFEEEAWARVTKLADRLGVDSRLAAGTVLVLWRDSQDVLALEGTRDQIVDWARLYRMPDPEIDRWISGMVAARILTETGKGTYKIQGNEIQIEGRVSRLNRAAKGAAATKAKWEAVKKAKSGETEEPPPPGDDDAPPEAFDEPGASTLEEGFEQASSLPQAGLCHSNAVQVSAEQCKPVVADFADSARARDQDEGQEYSQEEPPPPPPADCIWGDPAIAEFLALQQPPPTRKFQELWARTFGDGDGIWLENEIKTAISQWHNSPRSPSRYASERGYEVGAYLNKWLTEEDRKLKAAKKARPGESRAEEQPAPKTNVVGYGAGPTYDDDAIEWEERPDGTRALKRLGGAA